MNSKFARSVSAAMVALALVLTPQAPAWGGVSLH